MIKKFTEQEYINAKSITRLKLECVGCHKEFTAEKKTIKQALTHIEYSGKHQFCSKTCQTKAQITKLQVTCQNCNTMFLKIPAQMRSQNNFCSRNCAGTYNNKHKKHGTRVSKLEKYVQEQLDLKYPKLEIHYNRKDAINSELDIYIPSLKLAFELNGIFHYEPIYGIHKLTQIQNNDISKSKACFDNQIDLCIIDVSGQTYFKEASCLKYLNIITSIIDKYDI